MMVHICCARTQVMLKMPVVREVLQHETRRTRQKNIDWKVTQSDRTKTQCTRAYVQKHQEKKQILKMVPK